MSVLDGTIANTALPTIARDLGAAPAESIWVINGFQLAVTASLLPLAALGQLRGAARVYRAGVIVFIVGSLASALARSLPALIAARSLQGLGASAVMALSPALLREIFPRDQLGRALGLNSLVVATSSAAGPTLGGFILAVLPWPWLFALNVPFGIVSIAMNRVLPREPRGRGWLDVPSVATSAAGFALTIWGLDGIARGEAIWTVALRMLAGLSIAAWFVQRQFRLPKPMIALDLFFIRTFTLAGLTSFASFIAMGLAFVALPFYFQVTLGKTALESGLLLGAWPISVACMAPLAGRLSDRVPVAILSTAGLAVLTVGLALYALLPAHPSAVQIALHGVLCGVGFGWFQSPNNRELIGSAPPAKTTSASGLLAVFRVGGQTVGAALVALVFGVFGARIGGIAPGVAVAHAAPAVLWLACACAGLATLASAMRLRSSGTVPPMHTTTEQARAMIERGATVLNVGKHQGRREVRGAVRYRPHDLLTPDHLAIPVAPERPVVLYDENGDGDLTRQIADKLRENGFTDVHVLQGGFAAWERDGGATQEASMEQVVPPTRSSEVQELDRRV